MKNKEIYNSALRLLASGGEPQENADYEERAPYILASFCNEMLELDKAIRTFLELKPSSLTPTVWLDLEADFPLLDRFFSLAAKHLAAMLIIDEDGELSDKLYNMYCEGIALITKELPARLESIINKYK